MDKLGFYAARGTRPHWTIVYAGYQYMIYYLHYHGQGIDVVCSPLMMIDQSPTGIIPLLVYMILTARDDPKVLAKRLGLTLKTYPMRKSTRSIKSTPASGMAGSSTRSSSSRSSVRSTPSRVTKVGDVYFA